MSIFKGKLDSENEFAVIDSIRGLKIQSPDTDPAYFALEESDGTVQYFWVEADNIRMNTSAPDYAGRAGGTCIAGAGNSGANTALSNLGTTLANADIITADNINFAIGASSDMTIDFDGTDIEIAFAAANTVVNFGQTNPSDLEIWGANSYNLYWDASADELIFYDSAVLWFGGTMGANDGIFMYFDGTSDFHIDGSTADDVVNFGSTVDLDVRFHGGTDGSDVVWQADTDDWYLCDATHLGFGDDIDMYLNWNASNLELRQLTPGTGGFLLGVDDAGIDFTFFSDVSGDYIKWDASADLLYFEDTGISVLGANTEYQLAISTDALLLDEVNDNANGSLVLGASGTNGLNVTFQSITGGDTVVFDAGAKTFTFTDVSPVMADDDLMLFGSAAGGDVAIAWQNSGSTLDITQVTDGTGDVDFIDIPVLFTGADGTGKALITIKGIDTTGNNNTILLDHSGDGYAIDIDLNEATSNGIRISPHTNATVPALEVDGDGAGFLGAANVGMVLLRNDIALADVASSVLLIENGATAPINSGEGYAFRIADTSTVAGAEAFAAYIDATANTGLGIETRAAAARNLVLKGVQSQTASIAVVDGDTGTGWIGADVTGMLHISSKVAHAHIGATNLWVTNATGSVKASATGHLARFVNTAAAQAGANMVEITAKDNTEYALKVGAGMVLLSDWVHATGFHYTPTDITATDAGLQLTAIDGFYNADTTTADDGDIVLLPAGLQGMIIYLYNKDAAQEFVVTPYGAETLNGGGAGAGMNLAEDELCQLICTTDGIWVGNLIGTDGTYTKMT